MSFEGTGQWRPTIFKIAVNAASSGAAFRWFKGEHGPARRARPLEIAKALGAPLLEWHVKSTTKAMRVCMNMTLWSRARQPARGAPRAGHPQIHQARKLWMPSRRRTPSVLIAKSDKADIRNCPTTLARTRANGVLRLRDRKTGKRAAADRDHPSKTRFWGGGGGVVCVKECPTHSAAVLLN